MAQKPHRRTNTFITKGHITECYDAQGNMFLISTSSLDFVKQYYWSKQSNNYIVRPKDKKLLHRLLLDCPKGKVVDHINRDKSDNRLENLRVCTYTDNQGNRIPKHNNKYGGVKGIFLHPNGKYRVTIIKHKKTIHLGYFKTLEEAKEVRLNAEKEYFGEYRYKGAEDMIKRPIKKKDSGEQPTPQKKVNPKKIAEERKARIYTLEDELIQEGVIFAKPVELGGNLNIDNDYLTLPKDMTDVPSRLLGNYLNAYTQQRSYMRTLIGWQETVVEGAKRNYFDKYLPVYTELCKQKLSETAKELLANNDETVKDLFLNYKDEKQKLKMIGYSLASIEDAIFLISREISRRGTDFSTETRNDNISRR